MQSLNLFGGPRKLGGSLVSQLGAKGFFPEPSGLKAGIAHKSLRLNPRTAVTGDEDLDDLTHAAPPASWIVSLIDPSAKACSVATRPLRRASSFAFSQA